MTVILSNIELTVANIDTSYIDPSAAANRTGSILGSDEGIAYLEVSRYEGSAIFTGICAVALTTVIAGQEHLGIGRILGIQGQTGSRVKKLSLHIEEAVGAHCGGQVNICQFISVLDKRAYGVRCFRHIGLNGSHFVSGQSAGSDQTLVGNGDNAACLVTIAIYSNDCSASALAGNIAACIHSGHFLIGGSPGQAIISIRLHRDVQRGFFVPVQSHLSLVQTNRCQPLRPQDIVVRVYALQLRSILGPQGYRAETLRCVGSNSIVLLVQIAIAGSTVLGYYIEGFITQINCRYIVPAIMIASNFRKSTEHIARLQVGRRKGLAVRCLATTIVTGDQHCVDILIGIRNLSQCRAGEEGLCHGFSSTTAHQAADTGNAHCSVSIIGNISESFCSYCKHIKGSHFFGRQCAGSDGTGGQPLRTKHEVVSVCIQVIQVAPNCGVSSHIVFIDGDCAASILRTSAVMPHHQELAFANIQAGYIRPFLAVFAGGFANCQEQITHLEVVGYEGLAGGHIRLGSVIAAAVVSGYQHLGKIGIIPGGGAGKQIAVAIQDLFLDIKEAQPTEEGAYIDICSSIGIHCQDSCQSRSIRAVALQNIHFLCGQDAGGDATHRHFDGAACGEAAAGGCYGAFTNSVGSDLAGCIHSSNTLVRGFPSDGARLISSGSSYQRQVLGLSGNHGNVFQVDAPKIVFGIYDLLGTEDEVVQPLAIIFADDLRFGDPSRAFATADTFGDQELRSPLIQRYAVDVVAGNAQIRIDLSCHEDVTDLQFILGDQSSRILCLGTTVTAVYQHVGIGCVIFFFSGMPQIQFSVHLIKQGNFRIGYGLVGNNVINIHLGASVGPAGEVVELHSTVVIQPILEGQAFQTCLFVVRKLSFGDITHAECIDVFIGVGGTKDYIALISSCNFGILVDRLAQPCSQICHGFLIPGAYLGCCGISIRVLPCSDQELTAALIDGAQVSRNAVVSVTQNNHIANGEVIQGCKLRTCSEHSTTVVLHHGVQLLIAQRIACGECILVTCALIAHKDILCKQGGECSTLDTIRLDVNSDFSVNLGSKGQIACTPEIHTFAVLYSQSRNSILVFSIEKFAGCGRRIHISIVSVSPSLINAAKSANFCVQVIIGLAGPQDQEHIVGQSGHSCRGRCLQHLPVAIQRCESIVAQINQNTPGTNSPLLVFQAAGNRTSQVHIDQNVAGFQISDIGVNNTGLVIIIIGVNPNAAEVAFHQHITVDLIAFCHFAAGVQCVHIAGDGFTVALMQAIGLVELFLGEEVACQLLHSGKLQVKAGHFIVDPLCKIRSVCRVSGNLVFAAAVVPFRNICIDKCIRSICRLLAANGGCQHIGGDVCNRAAAADDLIAQVAGGSYSVADRHGRACGNVCQVPGDGAIGMGAAAHIGNIGSVCRDSFLYHQAGIGLAGVAAVLAVGGNVIFVVGIVGNGNGVGQLTILCHRTVVLHADSPVNVHAGIVQTGLGHSGNTLIAGGLDAVVIGDGLPINLPI